MLKSLVTLVFICAVPGHAVEEDRQSERYLDRRYEGIESSTPIELRLLRNEIFARHGRIFKSRELREYFSKKPWYKPNPGYSDAALTRHERELAEKMARLESSKGWICEAKRSVECRIVERQFHDVGNPIETMTTLDAGFQLGSTCAKQGETWDCESEARYGFLKRSCPALELACRPAHRLSETEHAASIGRIIDAEREKFKSLVPAKRHQS